MKLVPIHVAQALHASAETSEGPFCAYLYDLPALRAHAESLVRDLPPGCELYYAIKANSERPILQTLAPAIHGFEVSSGGELDWVHGLHAGLPIVFSGPGKTDAELRAGLEAGIEAFHVESLHELERLEHWAKVLGRPAPLLLRVNPAVEGLASTTLMMGGRPTPFGLAPEDLSNALARVRTSPILHFRGFHFHLLSHQLDAGAHLALLAGYLRQARAWSESFGLPLELLNVGGGLGVAYREPAASFDWPAFAEGLRSWLGREGQTDVRIRFELGRYLSAFCGYYAMEVLDLKTSHGQTFAIGRGGTHHFRTPAAQGHSHPFEVVPVESWGRPYARPEVRDARVTVVGQLCTPKDVLASDEPIGLLRCGDLLAFPLAGAYAWSISHHDFLRHPHPRVLLLGPESAT